MLSDRASWSGYLRSLAEPVLAGTPVVSHEKEPSARAWIDSFEDEAGFQRPVDRPLLAHMLGVDPGTPPERVSPDGALWWALHGLATDPMSLVRPGEGPLLFAEHDDLIGMEERTEAELIALHALRAHAACLSTSRDREGAGALLARCASAARWHLGTLQPDNATNRPWAVHVFVEFSLADDPESIDARLHAETLVSNCRVKLGRPDRLSACLLWDAARILDLQG